MAQTKVDGTSPPPPIKACLFDMDGLLINSEDLITVCINEILKEYSKLPLPWHVKAQLQGRPLSEASKIFHSWAQLPISEEEYQQKLKALHTKHFPTTKPLLGVERLLDSLSLLRTAGKMELALVTSSDTDKFELKTNHLQDLFAVFPAEHRVLGDDARIGPGRHKPAPDVYLHALECINDTLRQQGRDPIKSQECLVFEDAITGVLAGRRAGMQVLWVPHPELLNQLGGLEVGILNGPLYDSGSSKGREGWAKLLPSLEDFQYESYGISCSK